VEPGNAYALVLLSPKAVYSLPRVRVSDETSNYVALGFKGWLPDRSLRLRRIVALLAK
jgi:hypothetical protein